MFLEEYLKTHTKTHLVFDFDETVATLILPWQIILDQLDVEFKKISPEVAKRCQRWNWREYNQTINEYGPNITKMINKKYLDFEMGFYKGVKPNIELISFIKNNYLNYSFYIWSNNQRPTIERALKELKIEKYFKKLLTASDVTLYKPDPIGFSQIYDSAVDKKNYLMIGDSEGDRKAAENVGIDFLLCSNSS